MRARYASLSRREREVMALVACGRMNKGVADDLGISEITVKAHRGRVMRKMKARSFANLVIMSLLLQITPFGGETERALFSEETRVPDAMPKANGWPARQQTR